MLWTKQNIHCDISYWIREKVLNINIHKYISYFVIVISRIVIPMPSYTSLLYICFTLVIIPYQHFCIYTLYLVLLQYSLLVFGKEWFSLGAWINRLSLRCNSDRNTEQNHPDDYDKHIIFMIMVVYCGMWMIKDKSSLIHLDSSGTTFVVSIN